MNEIIEHFFDAYFHQDWREDYESSIDAVRDFCESEPENKKELAPLLKQFLELKPIPENLIQKCGGNFDPKSENLTVEKWLQEVINILGPDGITNK